MAKSPTEHKFYTASAAQMIEQTRDGAVMLAKMLDKARADGHTVIGDEIIVNTNPTCVTFSTPWRSDEWAYYKTLIDQGGVEQFRALYQDVWPPQEACITCGGYGQVLDAEDGQVECHKCRGTGVAKGVNKHG